MQNGMLKVVTQPPAEPITLDDAKQHCRVWISDDDTLLQGYIIAARSWAEDFIRRYLITTEVELALDDFPYCGEIRLPGGELQEVVSITYYDAAGALQTWDAAEYIVDTYAVPGRVAAKIGHVFPYTQPRQSAVIIRYKAGYAPGEGSPTDYAVNVPQSIKQAVRMLTGHFYENRESVVVGQQPLEVPMSVEALLWPFRICD